MKKTLLSTVTIFTLTTVTNADFIGAEVGYSIWNTSLSGNIQKGGSLNFENDLGYNNSEVNGFIWAYIDHPLPFLPNFKIQKTNFSDHSSGTMGKNTTFDGESFTQNEAVSSSLTLDQLDFIPYWRILDNWINLDVGLNFKVIDGNIKANNVDHHFDVLLPMLYTKARFDLPFTGLSIEADMSYIKYSDNKFADIKAGIVYETPIGLGVNAGYRHQDITLDDIDDTYGDLQIKGVYTSLFYHF